MLESRFCSDWPVVIAMMRPLKDKIMNTDNSDTNNMSTPTAGINLYRCNDLACLEISGPDAIAFLQSQLTQDMQLLTRQRAALAGYCTAQGRLLATMILVPTDSPQRVLAIVRADLMEGLIRRLRMFVLRSKVVLVPLSEANVFGLSVMSASTKPPQDLPMVAEPDWSVSNQGQCTFIRAPAGVAGCDRYWIIQEDGASPPIQTALMHDEASEWQVQDILAGMPWIEEATRDLFIAQTINLDLIDGVSFTKGCYPGQEVVARAHYRAKVKRRMHAGRIYPASQAILPGVDVYCASRPDEPSGRVIQVAHGHDASYVLFEAPSGEIHSSELTVLSSQGPGIEILQLPYSLGTTS